MAKYKETPDILGDVLSWKRPTAAPAQPEPEQIPVERIRVDGGTQMRAQLDDATVFEYGQAMIANDGWGTFPPVVAYYDGSTYWCGDGFHRLASFREAFADAAQRTVPCEVRAGDRRDAILYAAGANANHGLRRTNADKRRAVETLLRDSEWAGWSDHEIARRCSVDVKTVGNVRKELTRTMEIPQSTERKTIAGRTINTSNIGKRQATAAPPVSPEQRQYDMAVVPVAVPQPPTAKPASLDELPVVDSDLMFTTPGRVPADLAQRGWTLKTVPGSGRYYCHNPNGPRATGVFDKTADAIQAAYEMQVDLRSGPEAEEEAKDPEGQVETIEKMWSTRIATGVLRNMVEYWSTCQDFRLTFKRDPKNPSELAISLLIQTPNGGWHEWKGATLDDVVRKADLSL